jgi:hypothetical protein
MDHLRVAAEYSKIAASVHYAGLHVEAAQGLDCPIGREAFRNSSEINPDIGASEADGFSWKQFDRIRQLRPGWNWGIAGGARQKSHRLQGRSDSDIENAVRAAMHFNRGFQNVQA